jgi:hypothetical protein
VNYSEKLHTGRRPVPLSGSSLAYVTAKLPGEKIWLTEVGSRIDTKYNMAADHAGRLALQNQDVAFLVDRLAEVGDGVDRLYYYQLCEPNLDIAATPTAPAVRRHDSGLLDRGSGSGCGVKRPAYETYRAATIRNPFG